MVLIWGGGVWVCSPHTHIPSPKPGGRSLPAPARSSRQQLRRGQARWQRETAVLWIVVKSSALRNEATVETITFVDSYRGIIIPGFLRWCRISPLHSSNR